MNALRDLPSINDLLQSSIGNQLVADFGHELTTEAFRLVINQARESFLKEEAPIPKAEMILKKAGGLLHQWLHPSLYPVINATGVIVHTNLGRAPLSAETITNIQKVSQGYSTLEFDMEEGGRGSRLIHAESYFKQLLGMEAALVVNNNASAVLLALTVLTQGKKVIISRSQLVEIGGGFRIPDVLRHSGTELVEVGTTNKVHIFDYENAYNDETIAVMRAHPSNFSIVGFTSQPPLGELVASAQRAGLWFFDDLGSGALLDTSAFGLKHEPTVQESLDAGANLVCFSGDKLLGGPQAGIILGDKQLIDQLKVHPLARAIRADKMALAGLSTTLTHYLKGEALSKVPVWQMISATSEMVKNRAVAWKEKVGQGFVKASHSMVGGGSLPGETLPTHVLALNSKRPDQLLTNLRNHDPAVIARIEDDHVILDPRTVLPRQEEALLQAVLDCGRMDEG